MFKSVFKSGIRATYDVSSNASFVNEPWHIYTAKHNTTGKLASVFIFDKAKFESVIHQLCSRISNTKNPKVIINECYELIKYEVGQMAKLKHPQILTIYEVLEETKSKFLFVTESVTDNLMTVDFEKLDELSIQKGLLEVCKGIQFLHNYCSIVHMNLQPSSVFINQQGDWKLTGFRFLQNLNEISPQERESFFLMNNTSSVPFMNLNMNFVAPELVIDRQSKLDFGNDIWSLGCLIYYIYNKGEYLLNCFDQNSISDFKGEFRKFETKFYNHRVSDLKYVLKDIPDQLYGTFPSILARYPSDRINIDQFIDSDYFNGSLIKVMWFVDEFSTKSVEDRLIFLRGLLEVKDGKIFLAQFPQNFKTNKLLPLLIEFLRTELRVTLSKDEELSNNRIETVCGALEIVLQIGAGLSQLTFHDRIFEQLFMADTKGRRRERVDYFDKLISFSVKVRLVLITNLEILVEKLNTKDLTDLIKKSCSLILTLPSNEQHFKAEQIQAQDIFLSKTVLFIDKFDFAYIKNTFFPLICQVFKTTSILSTKLATVAVFENVVDNNIIDKIIVTEQLLPIFQNIKSRDKRIVSTVLKFFYKLTANDHISLDLDTVVESVLSVCTKLVFGCNECTQLEFKSYIKQLNDIQSILVKRKLSDLPTRDPGKSSLQKDPASNFESLINTQPINNNNMDKKVTGPQTPVMTPSRGLRQSTSPKNVGSFSHTPPIQPMNKKPAQHHIQPLHLKSEPHKKSNLNFGATSTTPDNKPTRLLHTLEGTFDKDEFSDFQSATPTPSSQTSSRISTPPTNISGSNMNSLVPKQPPGFNSSVLTPTANNRSSYNMGIKPQPHQSQNNDSLLDLI